MDGIGAHPSGDSVACGQKFAQADGKDVGQGLRISAHPRQTESSGVGWAFSLGVW